jgi:hypothetical protein
MRRGTLVRILRIFVLVGFTLWLLTVGSRGVLRQQPPVGEAATAPKVEARMVDSKAAVVTLREQAAALCEIAGPLVTPHTRVIALAADRHNRLLAVSDRELADLLTAVLVAENSGAALWRMPGMLDTIYPVWDGLQVASNSLGMDYSVGIGRIRPQTALEIRQGWSEHQGRVIYHNVQVFVPGDSGGNQISSQRLAEDDVSIEYLAANFEMGTAVAQAFGVDPTLLDLARWHNTGLGSWDAARVARTAEVWAKGSGYVARVAEADKILRSINGLAGCSEFSRPVQSNGEETS